MNVQLFIRVFFLCLRFRCKIAPHIRARTQVYYYILHVCFSCLHELAQDSLTRTHSPGAKSMRVRVSQWTTHNEVEWMWVYLRILQVHRYFLSVAYYVSLIVPNLNRSFILLIHPPMQLLPPNIWTHCHHQVVDSHAILFTFYCMLLLQPRRWRNLRQRPTTPWPCAGFSGYDLKMLYCCNDFCDHHIITVTTQRLQLPLPLYEKIKTRRPPKKHHVNQQSPVYLFAGCLSSSCSVGCLSPRVLAPPQLVLMGHLQPGKWWEIEGLEVRCSLETAMLILIRFM